CTVNPKEIGLPYLSPYLRFLDIRLFPIGPAVGEERRAPGVPGFGPSRLSVAPGDKSRTPGVAFAQSGIAEVFLYPLSVVVSGGLLHTELPLGDPQDFRPQAGNCRFSFILRKGSCFPCRGFFL